MANNKIDRSKAFAKKKFQFPPFLPKNAIPLGSANLRPDEDLLIFDRGGQLCAHAQADGLSSRRPGNTCQQTLSG